MTNHPSNNSKDLRRKFKDITSGMYYELKDGEHTFDEAENRVIDQAMQLFESHTERLIKEARLDTASTALRACPTHDNMLRVWLEKHMTELQSNTSGGSDEK